jgi:Protein of unknown function (DUF3768)
MDKERSRIIRDLNDVFRTTFVGGRVMLTSGVAAMPTGEAASVLSAVRAFKDFDEGNDPHKEHDLGSFRVAEEEFFWKIDYYDKSMEFGSEDPSDPAQTTRVLTIMFAYEY